MIRGVVAILLLAAFALTGLGGHLYVLKKPMGYLAEARDTFFDLRRSHPSDQPIEARIRSVEASTAALREQLQEIMVCHEPFWQSRRTLTPPKGRGILRCAKTKLTFPGLVGR